MIAHPLEEGVLPDDFATKTPVHEGILDLVDQLLLIFRHRSHELCARLGPRRHADIPPHQHERRPAAGHQHTPSVEHKDIKIIDGEGALAAEHRQRPVPLLTIVGHGPDQQSPRRLGFCCVSRALHGSLQWLGCKHQRRQRQHAQHYARTT
ncbi:hypothetical protein D3C85_1451040 [compost metagenome]